ncbi:hypothetical protein ACFLXK_06595 [Chloroflexota bacterium]
METATPKTWQPKLAGILNIVSGSFRVFCAIGLIIVITVVDTWKFLTAVIPPEDLPFVAPMVNTILILLLVASIMETVFPIIGGVFALQRRRWGWALGGSIVAIFGMLPLGVASTILVAMAKEEFE